MNVNYISQQGLRNLAGYAYHGEDLSILRRLFLNRFWNELTTYYPVWLAPNLITFTSFLILTGNMLTMYYYCPEAVGCDLPPWTFLSFAIGVFLYQTLDNTDGKQAVRTNSSSALGELFDHGCDSLFPTFAGITILAAAGFDSAWQMFAFIHIGMIPFVLAHWEEYHTGILILGPIANPTEAETAISIFHLVTWWKGTSFWSTYMRDVLPAAAADLFKLASLEQLLNWRINEFGGTVALIATIPIILWNIYTVGKHCTSTKKCGMLYACWPLLPFAVHTAFSTAWLWFSPSKILETHTFLAIVWYGIVVSYLLIRLILDRITKVENNPFQFIMLFGLVGLVFALTAPVLKIQQHEANLLKGMLVITVALFLHMVVGIINELCEYLKISVFSIPHPPTKAKGSK